MATKLTRSEAIENIRCLMLLNTAALPDEAIIGIHDRIEKLCSKFNTDLRERMKQSGYDDNE